MDTENMIGQRKIISSTHITSRSIVVNGAIMNGGRVIHQKTNTKDNILYSCYEIRACFVRTKVN